MPTFLRPGSETPVMILLIDPLNRIAAWYHLGRENQFSLKLTDTASTPNNTQRPIIALGHYLPS